ncbi:MAG: aminotransferase DegT [Candidatus Sericytochromatia bacterium]|nr:MAG: aminotransferase DegT [Candidatus Sericytochromatia bacterium]
MYKDIASFIRKLYSNYDNIALHAPVFLGNEKKYLTECIDSTYVSYIGAFVEKFEKAIEKFTGSRNCISIVNGTMALYLALKVLGVNSDSEVITQALTFVGTINPIIYCGASPIFVDVDRETLGMSPESLKKFILNNTIFKNGLLINKSTQKRISAILPVHIFGHPCRIDEIIDIAKEYNIYVIEDAAEAIGSFYKNKHCGTFGLIGILSFNGNKTITTGGGGAILTNDDELANRIRHISKTAKVNHKWEYIHDEVGYNLRMPNINAAIGLAQLEYIDIILKNKRETANIYSNFFEDIKIKFFKENYNSKSNYWLNTIFLKNIQERNDFLDYMYSNKIQARPIWQLMHKLDMYKNFQRDELLNSEYFYDTIVNLPSGYRLSIS